MPCLSKVEIEVVKDALRGYAHHRYYREADSGDNDHYFTMLKLYDSIITKLEKGESND